MIMQVGILVYFVDTQIYHGLLSNLLMVIMDVVIYFGLCYLFDFGLVIDVVMYCNNLGFKIAVDFVKRDVWLVVFLRFYGPF